MPKKEYVLIIAVLGIVFWKWIVTFLQGLNVFSRRISVRAKIKESLPAFLNFGIATLFFYVLYDTAIHSTLFRFQRPIVLGLYLIVIVVFMKRINELLLLVFLPYVRRTKTVLDDQILLFTFATLKYSIIPIAVYLWVVYGLKIELSEWTKAGFAISIAAIGFAFRNIINDFLASVIINIEQEVKVKDYITINGNTGKVWKIEPRYTVLKSIKGEELIIPNSDLINFPVINHSKRQFISIHINFWVPQAHHLDTERLDEFVRNECKEDLLTDHELSNKPVINIYKTDLKSISVQYTITFLIRATHHFSGKVSYVENKIKEREIEQKIFDFIHEDLLN